MPKFLLKRWYAHHVIVLFVVSTVFLSVITYFQWQLGVFGFIILTLVAIYAIQARLAFKQQLEEYISTLSYRVHKAGEEAFAKMPIGILLYNEHLKIQWCNTFVQTKLADDIIEHHISEIDEQLVSLIEEGVEEKVIPIKGSYYHVTSESNERLLYFF